jgi:hypothetical protein
VFFHNLYSQAFGFGEAMRPQGGPGGGSRRGVRSRVALLARLTIKEKTEEQYLLPGLMTQRNCCRFTLDSKMLMVQLVPSQWSAVLAVITDSILERQTP